LDEAALKVQNNEVEAIAKVEEKETLTKLLEDFQNHAEGSAPDLVKRIEALGANDSMVMALPAMLSKPASERGSFDLMVFTSVREWLDNRIGETSEVIASAEPTKAANAEALSNAQATLKDACEKQLEGAEAYWKMPTWQPRSQQLRPRPTLPMSERLGTTGSQMRIGSVYHYLFCALFFDGRFVHVANVHTHCASNGI